MQALEELDGRGDNDRNVPAGRGDATLFGLRFVLAVPVRRGMVFEHGGAVQETAEDVSRLLYNGGVGNDVDHAA